MLRRCYHPPGLRRDDSLCRPGRIIDLLELLDTHQRYLQFVEAAIATWIPGQEGSSSQGALGCNVVVRALGLGVLDGAKWGLQCGCVGVPFPIPTHIPSEGGRLAVGQSRSASLASQGSVS